MDRYTVFQILLLDLLFLQIANINTCAINGLMVFNLCTLIIQSFPKTIFVPATCHSESYGLSYETKVNT